MTRTIIGLFLFSFLIMSVVSFEDAYANINNNPTNQYNPPTIIFDEREYTQDEIITLTCIPDDQKPTTNIIWFLWYEEIDRTEFKHAKTVLSLNASDYIPGDYSIKCRTNFGNGHVASEWVYFTIMPVYEGGIQSGGLESTNGIDTTIVTTESENNNGSSSCPDCVAPTAGVDNNGNRLVDFGAVLNGEAFQLDNFKTHIPMMFTEIGVENHLEIKVYENHGAYNIDFMEFGIVKEIGSSMNIFEPRLEIDIKNTSHDIHNPALEGVELFDKQGIINEHRVELSLVDCMEGFTHECLKLDIYWTFAKVPENKVLAFGGWDNTGSSFVQYLNDGLTVTDPNYTIPEADPTPEEKECRIYKVPKRIHTCQFQPMIDHEIQIALETLEKMK